MALLDNLKSGIINWAVKSAGMPIMSSTGQRYQAPDRRAFEQQTKAYMNQVVLACIATRATTLNEPPLVAVDPISKQPIMQHPLTRLFRRPNKHMSQSQFWQYVSTYIDIGGNCYIHKVRNVYGQVIELRPYHSGHIVPISESGQWVDFYKYSYEGVEKEIDPRDIIHLRSYYIDPLNPVLGISPIRAAGINVDTYNELMATLYSYLRNNGVPSGVLSVQQTINAQQAESLKEQFQSNTTGANRGKPVVLPSGMSYTQMGLDVSKMEASSQFKQYETAICSIYRISSSVVMTASAIDSKYSNMQTAFQEYTTLTRVPTWNTWEEQVELAFVDEYPEVDVEFDVSNVGALQADVTMQASVITQFTSNLITVNEARQKLGYTQLEEDGDRYSYDLSAPAPSFGFGSSNAADATPEPSTGIVKGLKWQAPELPQSGKIDQSADVKAEAFWKGMDKTIRDYSERLQGPTQELIEQVGKVLVGDVKKQGGKSLAVKANDPRLQLLIERYMKSTGKWREQLLQEITKLAVTEVGGDLAAVESYLDKTLTKITGEMAANITDSIGSIQTDVQATVNGLAGSSADEIEQALLKKFETLPPARAKAIARTTARASSTEVATSTWSTLNDDETDPDEEVVKVWTTRRDGVVRASHRSQDGEWVTMGGTFTNGTKGPGVGGGDASDVVNCRCVLRPVRRKNLSKQSRG
ncbi:Phage portal protein, HK97 [uncultured Caudovirales phage]|uniref:Phage portal protein, HK97 n=1 Tax=uncultured Caudovirales phage TaxID=2100421 RepID=A0A6J5M7X8_9CAUD|nr:Phage portal protein, HK97 [uncultured Caudovirales phage]